MSQKYFVERSRSKKQLKILAPTLLSLFIASLYSTGYKNEIVRIVMVSLTAGCGLFLIGLSVISAIPGMTYYVLDEKGIRIIYGFYKRQIAWKNIEKIEEVYVANIEVIGIMYGSTPSSFQFVRKVRRRMLGWDDFLSPAFNSGGVSLLVDAKKSLKNDRHN